MLVRKNIKTKLRQFRMEDVPGVQGIQIEALPNKMNFWRQTLYCVSKMRGLF